ncbi:MAG: MoaD/ThiS family protein [Deltaproteobacteria bacterium]|nr:MoaD/ThiS family protein [Deltaproteobacteria bacterium]
MERESSSVGVRLFGALHSFRKAQGLPTEVEVVVSPRGTSAAEIAADLGLPPELVEAVFCNHRVYGLSHLIRPGDRVAFVPHGTPGPHRYTLGIYGAERRRC